MKSFLKSITVFFLVISCTDTQNIQQYSIETLMSNNRSSGGYFSKDADKLIYSSDKSGIFNIYEVDLSTNEETQLTDSKEESFFVRGYSPNTGEVIYSADKGGNENSHIYLIREGNSIDLTPGENTKASYVGWTNDELGMYIISNSRDPRFFDLYKIDIETLESEMVFKNDSGYNDKGAMLKSLPSVIRGLEKTLCQIDRCDDKDQADFCPKKSIQARIDRGQNYADELLSKITRWQKGDGQNSWRSERRWAIDGIRELESALEVIRWVELQGGNK